MACFREGLLDVFGHIMLVDGLSTLYQLYRRLQGSEHILFVGKFKHFFFQGKVKLHLSMCGINANKIVLIQGNVRLH